MNGGQGSLFDALPDPRRDMPAPAHSPARDTEAEAARLVRPKAGNLRAACLDALAASPGLTDAELAERVGIYLYTAAPRRVELCRDGWVEDSGVRRQSGHGRTAIVWRVTAAGRAVLGNG